jgi:hypothetical protein
MAMIADLGLVFMKYTVGLGRLSYKLANANPGESLIRELLGSISRSCGFDKN